MKFKNILSKLHLSKPDREHSKFFEKVSIKGCKKRKSLKDILVTAKVPPLKTKEGFCCPCNEPRPRCEICKHIKTHQFESSSTKHIYSIWPQNLNCSSKNVIYLFTCKTCHKQYTWSTEEFWSRLNIYRWWHRDFFRNKIVKQVSFHAHLAEGIDQGETDWEVRLIDQEVSVDKRES